jgi:methyl-accepting chemotaxis protein
MKMFSKLLLVLVIPFAGMLLIALMSGPETSAPLIMVVMIVSALLALGLGWAIVQSMRQKLAASAQIMQSIANGDLDTQIDTSSKDEVGELLSNLAAMQATLKTRLDREGAVASENARIRVALDNASSNVMLADQNNDIVYLNAAAQQLFTGIENDLARDIPGFKASEIIGSNVDRFHKNPSYQQQFLANLNREHHAQFVTGGRTMAFTANPVKDKQGNRLGTVVEWIDKTQELVAETEIQSIVQAVQAGDLERRIDDQGKTGFFLALSEAINSMIEEIAGTMKDINVVISALSKGDLTQVISNQYQGTFGSVAQNINTTIEELSSIVSEIRTTADQVSITALEIQEGNNSLSARTEHQAAALEETASSMEQLTGTVRQNENNAQQANTLSTSARDIANKGGQVIDETIDAMSEISIASKRIAEIISVIDEIAFQTNLLALNASVEAARAGEQGRGFAVVATEVRNLAQRSATSAKEIKALIQDSVSKVETGSELVNRSGETLKEIVQGVKKVRDIVGEIAAASAEQTSGIEQVNAAVSSMDESTQQNAALAEETSAASVAMADHSQAMAHRLEFFQLSDKWRNQHSLMQTQTFVPKPSQKPDRQPVSNPVITDAAKVSSEDDDDWEEF